jgi:hypothetical protein
VATVRAQKRVSTLWQAYLMVETLQAVTALAHPHYRFQSEITVAACDTDATNGV